MSVRLQLSTTAVSLCLLLMPACGGDGASESAPAPYVVNGPPSSALAGSEIRPLASIEEFMGLVEAVVRVTPIRREPDVWDRVSITVSARFRVRVDHVYHGNLKEGDELLLRLPGGTSAKYFPATGSRRPRPGEEVIEEEVADFPYFRMGVTEVVFLAQEDDYWASIRAYSRYHLVNGRLRSVVPDSVETLDIAGIQKQIEAVREADLPRFIAGAKARPVPPTPTPVP